MTYEARSPDGRRSLTVSGRPDNPAEGTLRIGGGGRECRIEVGRSSGEMFPFWVDDHRVGYHTEVDGEEALRIFDVRKRAHLDGAALLKGLVLAGNL